MLAAFVADRERAARFEREARTLAALNHPNVATLYGMEEADGQHFLVMELVEGATLAEILPLRFVIPFPEGQERTVITRPALAISPDGTLVAYVANRQIYLRTIGSLDARPITGTSHDVGSANAANPISPVFSPDGRSIAYWQQGDRTIKRVEVMGGASCTFPARSARAPRAF